MHAYISLIWHIKKKRISPPSRGVFFWLVKKGRARGDERGGKEQQKEMGRVAS